MTFAISKELQFLAGQGFYVKLTRMDSSPLRSHSLDVKTLDVLTSTQITPLELQTHPFNPLQNPPQAR
ncbi:hypothetical protein [Nostoc flagelliforme]|nr:hypothetical protein [Nostoc flagelliforme]